MAAPSFLPNLTLLSADELRALVTDLVTRLQARREENAALKDEIARLKGLKGYRRDGRPLSGRSLPPSGPGVPPLPTGSVSLC